MSYRPSPFLDGLREHTAADNARIKSGFPYHSLELPGGEVIPGLIPTSALRRRLDLLGVPADLTGLSALDAGAASGWNSFELERRGATVTALDYVPYEEFLLFKDRCRSNVRYVIADFERLSPGDLGTFDLVLFLGVLYHLRNPLLALETLCSLCTGDAYIESYIFDSHHESGEQEGGASLCEFYETDELAGQIDNWWGPSRRTLCALCRAAGFTQVDLRYIDDRRAGLVCSRRPYRPTQASSPAPFLSGVASNRSGLPVFTQGNDEYLNIYFDSTAAGLTRGSIHVRFGEFGLPVLTLSSLGGKAFQATVRMPSWANPGTHEASLCTADSDWSNAVRITVEPARGPQQDTPNPYAREFRLAVDSSWSNRITIDEASVTARKTAFGDRRVLNVSASLRLDGLDVTTRHKVALAIDGRWFAATLVSVTPKGLLQAQLLNVLDAGSDARVTLCAALPDHKYYSPELSLAAVPA